MVAFATTSSSVSLRGLGSCLPRLSARRRIPRHAVGLKKYLCGTSRVSKTSDKKHTSASLGHSEVLSVKHSPANAIPEFCQLSEQALESASLLTFKAFC